MSDKNRGKETHKEARREVATGKFVRSSKGKPLTRESGIFKIVGIGESKKPGGYSTCKHELVG